MNIPYNVFSDLQKLMTYLHVHSEYSNIRLLDSINRPERMIEYVNSLGGTSLALTDHESLSGHVQFIQVANKLKKENKISQEFKVILGNEIYLVDEDELQESLLNNEEKTRFYHFLLLAKNANGHEQLRILSSKAWERMFSYRGMDRVPTYYSDFEDVDTSDLIASTACLGSFFAQNVLNLVYSEDNDEKQVFKQNIHDFVNWGIKTFGEDDFYIEIQPSHAQEQIDYNKMAIKIAEAYGLKYTITTDAHYLKKEDRNIHKAYLTSADKEGKNREVDDFYSTTYFMKVEEIFEHLEYLPEETVKNAIVNTYEISQKIEEYDLHNEQEIPKTELPSKSNWKFNKNLYSLCSTSERLWIKHMIDSEDIYENYLINQVFEGISKRIPQEDLNETLDRVNVECMEIVGSSLAKGKILSSYFTTMQKNIDIIWNEAQSIVGAGRGSAGGYIIDYLLDITQVNPLKQGIEMPHWRFISAERPDYPDIDIDVPSHKRDIVFKKIHNYYKGIGGDIVRVCTFGTETSKSAMKTGCRGLEINSDVANYLTSLIPVERGAVWSISDCYYGNEEKNRTPIKEFIKTVDEAHSDLLNVVLGIEGLINKRSSHACGALIVNEAFTKRNAIMRTPSGEIVSQFNLGDSEYVGDMKYDLLNTKTCSMIQKTMELLIEANRIKWQGSLKETYDKYLHPDVLEKDDPKLWEILNKGQLISAFQFDSPVGEQAIKSIQPVNMLEAVDANNLMRLMGEEGKEPPMELYVRYKNDINEWYSDMHEFGLEKEEIEIMRDHLEKNYGVCSTQEGMMMLTMDKRMANFNVVESNILRKGVAKKVGDKYDQACDLFYKKGKSNNVRRKLLDYVWEVQIAMQRGYGFSLLHGIEYTYILIQQLNLVFRFPPIYWNTGVLLVESGAIELENPEEENTKKKATNYGKIAKSIGDLKSRGVKIELPTVNNSKFGFHPDEANDQIIFGLKGIVGINNDTAHSIIENRPYNSLLDFHKRLVETKVEVTLSTGKKQNKSIVPSTTVINLIKGGAFDRLESKPRRQIMKEYLSLINPPKKSFNMKGIDQVIDLGIIPEKLKDAVKIYNFRKFLTNKKHLVKISETAKSKKWYRLIGANDSQTEYISNFFAENFGLDLDEGKDYYIDEKGYMIILTGGSSVFEKRYKELTENIKKWLNSSDCLDRYNKHIWDELWLKHAEGTISKWEMESLSFYYHEHELAHVNREKYGLENFNNLKDSNEYTTEEKNQFNFSMYKGIKYPQFPLTRICGTVLDKNKDKHSITLLTSDGVVLVKYYAGAFGHYDKQVSIINEEDGKKTVLEKSWFTRGNKLLITGYRRGDQFKPKIYRGDAYQHTTCLIENIREDGILELKTERTKI